MILSKDEALCLVLHLSSKKEISSRTKLNKLLARLNLHFIPIDIEFSLNKFGSFSAELSGLEETNFYGISSYQWGDGKTATKYTLKPQGEELYEKVIKPKLDKIMTANDFAELKKEIEHLSTLAADRISDDEHKKLLVDVDDKFKLQQHINITATDLFDLYDEVKKLHEDSIATVRLKALVEYCFYLMKYLKEVRFKNLSEDYDFEAYMFDYYFLYNIHKIVGFLKQQASQTEKDGIRINKYYQYIINSVGDKYPFSIDNPNLKELTQV